MSTDNPTTNGYYGAPIPRSTGPHPAPQEQTMKQLDGDIFDHIDEKPIRWERNGIIHDILGTQMHQGVRLLWTACARDVPANSAFTSGEPVTCDLCIAWRAKK